TPNVSDQMGFAVTRVGKNIAVSDPNDNLALPGAGAVYIYDGTTGQLLRTLRGTASFDRFGQSLAAFGDLLLIGAPSAQNFTGGPRTGNVYIYEGSTGRFLGNLFVPNGGGGEEFGSSMSVVGEEVIVGAPGDNPFFTGNVGAAYRFNILTHDSLTQYYLTAATAAVGDRFGAAVAASGDRVFI